MHSDRQEGCLETHFIKTCPYATYMKPVTKQQASGLARLKSVLLQADSNCQLAPEDADDGGDGSSISWLKWTGAAVLFVEALIVSSLSQCQLQQCASAKACFLHHAFMSLTTLQAVAFKICSLHSSSRIFRLQQFADCCLEVTMCDG